MNAAGPFADASRRTRRTIGLAVAMLAPLVAVGCGAIRREALRHDLREAVVVDAILTQVMRHIASGAVDSIATLLAPDFVLVEGGRRYTRAEYLSGLRGQRTTEIAARFANRHARVVGSAAYITYDLQSTYSSNGVRNAAEEQGTIVLQKHDAEWGIVLWQIADVTTGGR